MSLDGIIKEIRISSAWGPDIVIDQPFSGAPSASGGSALMGLLKPQITIVPAINGVGEQVVAPWGAPGPTKWPMVEAALVLAVLLGIGIFLRR